MGCGTDLGFDGMWGFPCLGQLHTGYHLTESSALLFVQMVEEVKLMCEHVTHCLAHSNCSWKVWRIESQSQVHTLLSESLWGSRGQALCVFAFPVLGPFEQLLCSGVGFF